MAGAGPPGWTLRRNNWHFFCQAKKACRTTACRTNIAKHRAKAIVKQRQNCVSVLKGVSLQHCSTCQSADLIHMVLKIGGKKQLQLLSKWFCSNQLCMPTAAHLDLCSRVRKKRISNSHIYVGYIYICIYKYIYTCCWIIQRCWFLIYHLCVHMYN